MPRASSTCALLAIVLTFNPCATFRPMGMRNHLNLPFHDHLARARHGIPLGNLQVATNVETTTTNLPAIASAKSEGLRSWTRRALPPLAALVVLDRFLRRLPLGVPHQLVGMLSGFGLLCLGHGRMPAASEAAVRFFAPACQTLSRWLPAIFAPAFITLPYTTPSLATHDLLLFVVLCALGFVFSTATNTLLYNAMGSIGRAREAQVPTLSHQLEPSPRDSSAVGSQRNQLMVRPKQVALAAISLLCAAASLLGVGPSILMDACLLMCTLLFFSVTSSFPASLNTLVHPFLSTSAAMMSLCTMLALFSSQPWHNVLLRYHVGAGKWLLSLMGPTVISFAFQLFSYRRLLVANLLQIVVVGIGGAACGMFASVVSARVLGVAEALRVALLCRSTTTALAGEVARLSSAEPALGMLAAFITGLFGIWFGVRLRIKP